MNPSYDPLTQYCPVRRHLEQNGFDLVGRLAVLTERLLRLIGRDRPAFANMKAECVSVRAEVVDARQKLAAHRLAHGC